MFKKIYFANDHAGFELKSKLIEQLSSEFDCIDLGSDEQRCDYPDYAQKLASALSTEASAMGVLICGSGLGISMAANRFAHIRAALCHCEELARLAREHNDANVIVFGARFVASHHAADMIRVFSKTDFAGQRHSIRVEKLGKLRD